MASALTNFGNLFVQSTVWQTLAAAHATVEDSIFYATGESETLPVVVISQNNEGSISGSGDSTTFVSNGGLQFVIHLSTPAGANVSAEYEAVQDTIEDLKASLTSLAGTGTNIVLRTLVIDPPKRSDKTVENKAGLNFWKVVGNAEWGLEGA